MKNKKEFIEKANKIYNNKYDYSLVEYKNSQTKVKIICPIHGEFMKEPANHTRSNNKHQGCPKCGNLKSASKRKISKEEYIEKVNKIHNNFYDYSLVSFENIHEKIKIICPKHGVFEQKASNHLHNKQNCPFCVNNNFKSNTEDFIKKAIKIHGDKYDYSLVEYINNKTNVKIILDGEIYEQSPKSHLKGMSVNGLLSLKEFIRKSIKIHGDKYDYSSVKFTKTTDIININCIVHGNFKQRVSNHLNGNGCPLCVEKQKKSNIHFINECKKIHGNKYDYSLSKYDGAHKKIKIICPIHGIFTQTPNSHINKSQGCPKCNTNISKGEIEIEKYLKEHNIEHKTQKRFNDCKNKKVLPFDFYLPKHNICIEYDGKQHYKSIPYWGGDDAFKTRQKLDKIKTEYCINNNIQLIRIKYNENIKEKLIDLIQ